MIDSGSKGYPEQESAGCHFCTLGRNFLRAKTKWPPYISRSNMIFQQMKPGTSVIPHFHVILVIIKVKRSISRSNKQKHHFYQLKLGTCVIPLFSWDFV